MFCVKSCPLPSNALLQRYANAGDYTDCYRGSIRRVVTQEQYIHAFYTTPVFRLERTILRLVANRPSNDADVARMANGRLDVFAAWRVEQRSDHQLLLCDYLGRTRSWLMTAPCEGGAGSGTNLYFGSAIVRATDPSTAKEALTMGFRLLLGFHQLYSRILLQAASSALQNSRPEA